MAIRHLEQQEAYGRDDETGLSFAGFLLFLDPPKADVQETLAALARRGVSVKVITGDNRYVAAHLAQAVGLRADRIMTGEQLARMTRNALFGLAPHTDLFVEIDPNQKERIVEALRMRGHVVGYLGDGINDAPALHAADIGISVDSAVDVAREAADMILLKQDLGVLLRGVDDGRRTFANTMKYISITTSANFGNMFSMAFASMFLPFLPLLAKQILLNNLLSSMPSLAIAGDNVDAEQISAPRRWDIGFVRRFMISFGLISSVFDFLTFGFLLLIMHATADTFRTAWFVESLLTQLAIVLIVRTHKAFWSSRPSPLLGLLTLGVGAAGDRNPLPAPRRPVRLHPPAAAGNGRPGRNHTLRTSSPRKPPNAGSSSVRQSRMPGVEGFHAGQSMPPDRRPVCPSRPDDDLQRLRRRSPLEHVAGDQDLAHGEVMSDQLHRVDLARTDGLEQHRRGDRIHQPATVTAGSTNQPGAWLNAAR